MNETIRSSYERYRSEGVPAALALCWAKAPAPMEITWDEWTPVSGSKDLAYLAIMETDCSPDLSYLDEDDDAYGQLFRQYSGLGYALHDAQTSAARDLDAAERLRERIESYFVEVRICRVTNRLEPLFVESLGGVDVDPFDNASSKYLDRVASDLVNLGLQELSDTKVTLP